MLTEIDRIDQAYQQIAAGTEPLNLQQSPVTIKEISRATGLPVTKIISLIWNNPEKLNLQLKYPETIYQLDIPKEQRIARQEYEQSLAPPKRVDRLAQSLIKTRKTDGSGRAREMGTKINSMRNIQKTDPWEKVQGQLGPARLKIIPRLLKPEKQIETNEPNWEINYLIDWFKALGSGKNWLLGTQENKKLLTQDLIDFSKGVSVELIIWNCIGFQWFQPPDNGYPFCDITANLDASIVDYFRERIVKIKEALSTIGEPQITILSPSHEALDENIWRYRQSQAERNGIINRSVNWLGSIIPGINAERWDNFLRQRGITASTETYSQQGCQKISLDESNLSEEIDYFTSRGIKVTNQMKQLLLEGRQKYLGAYAGEGIAFNDLRRLGRKIVVINFEEMRVPQMIYAGADSQISILTPCKNNESEAFYRWEKDQELKRI